MTNHENELAESRRYYQYLVERFEATDEGPAAAAAAASRPVGKLLKVKPDGLERQKRFRCSAPQALAHLNELDLSRDLGAFVAAMTVWRYGAVRAGRGLVGRSKADLVGSQHTQHGNTPLAPQSSPDVGERKVEMQGVRPSGTGFEIGDVVDVEPDCFL